MKWFRKSFLLKIQRDIIFGKKHHCCNVNTWHRLFICWKDLKEVKENMQSNYLKIVIKNNYAFHNCDYSWFYDKSDRLSFLQECVIKFND